MVSKTTGSTSVNNSAPLLRITPISSAMLAATRPRDPRLSRQQPPFAGVPHNTSNNIETVIIDEKHKVKKPSSTISIDCANNKINKAGAISNTLTRKDPRLSKQVPGSKSNKSSNGRPASSDRSPTKSKSSPTPRKPASKSLNRINFVQIKGSSTNNNNNNPSSTNIITSDSNNSNSSKSVLSKDKGSSESNSNNNSSSSLSSSLSQSPTKLNSNKKRESEVTNKSPRSSNKKAIIAATASNNSESVKSRFRDKHIDESTPGSAEETEQRSAFKGLKTTTKNRNYMRRNRGQSSSPERPEPAQDVDLRLSAPPEKQLRLACDPPSNDVEEVAKSKTLEKHSQISPVLISLLFLYLLMFGIINTLSEVFTYFWPWYNPASLIYRCDNR